MPRESAKNLEISTLTHSLNQSHLSIESRYTVTATGRKHRAGKTHPGTPLRDQDCQEGLIPPGPVACSRPSISPKKIEGPWSSEVLPCFKPLLSSSESDNCMVAQGTPRVVSVTTKNPQSLLSKRKGTPERGGPASKKPRSLPEPTIYPRPRGKVSFWIDGTWVPARAMLDSGSNVFLMSPVFSRKWGVPKVQRDVPIPIQGFDGEAVSGAGHAFTQPIRMLIGTGHISTISCEIGLMEPGLDLIIPGKYLSLIHI